MSDGAACLGRRGFFYIEHSMLVPSSNHYSSPQRIISLGRRERKATTVTSYSHANLRCAVIRCRAVLRDGG